MPRRAYDEDLFKDTTMTFGEHLEELRGSLFRALIGLVIGFLVGLFVGNRVVQFIQTPLTAALTQYYEDKDLAVAEAKLQELKDQGKPLPSDPEQLKALVKDQHLIPEAVYIEPEEIVRALREKYPAVYSHLEVPQVATPSQTRTTGNAASPPTEDTNTAEAVGNNETAEPNQPDTPTATAEDMLQIFVWHPVVDDQRIRVKSLNAHEAFVIYVKASLLVGAMLASPWIFYQLWSFVAAGLYPHEKHYVHFFLPISLGLFLAGAVMAFFFVMEPVLQFLFGFNRWMGIDPDPRISEWLGFVLILPLGFGIAFQLPLVMLFLERIGIFDVEAYISKWRLSVLVIFVLSMFLTPADPYSMFLMAVPLLILYAAGILLCKFLPKNTSPYDEE